MANPLHFIRMYFNCAYFLGIIPYRFVYSAETRNYLIVRSIWQRILWIGVCLLTASNCLYYAVQEYVLQNSLGRISGKPAMYFSRVSLMTDVVLFIIILITQCGRSEEMLKVMNAMNEVPNYIYSSHKNQIHVFCVPLLFLALLLLPVIIIFSYFSNASWDLGIGIGVIRDDGIAQIFLIGRIPESIGYTILFATFRTLAVFSYALFMASGELLLLSSCFTINDCLNRFSESVKNEDTDGMQVYDEFLRMKNIIGLLNESIGLLIFGIVFAVLPYFVVTFASFVKPQDILEFAINVLEFTILYGFLGLAANIGRKANIIMDRFVHTKDLSGLSFFQLNSMLHDVDSHFSELSCAGFCHISPNFVGGMIQLLLTFSVILIQFQMTK